jgi:hypothetical protein
VTANGNVTFADGAYGVGGVGQYPPLHSYRAYSGCSDSETSTDPTGALTLAGRPIWLVGRGTDQALSSAASNGSSTGSSAQSTTIGTTQGAAPTSLTGGYAAKGSPGFLAPQIDYNPSPWLPSVKTRGIDLSTASISTFAGATGFRTLVHRQV